MCKDIGSIDIDCLDYFNIDENLVAAPVERNVIANRFRPKLGTIYSAKGKIHTATLYLESYYDGHYETEFSQVIAIVMKLLLALKMK